MSNYNLSIFNNSLSRALKNLYLKDFFENEQNGDNILDYGSGYTPYKNLALTKYKNYYTAEFPKTSEKLYNNKSDYTIFENEKTDCPDSFFETVLITEVLEHVYKPVNSLAEIYRILKKGGKIVGTVPFQMNEHDQPYDYFRYTNYSLTKMLEESNFKNINIQYVGDSIGSLIFLTNRNFGFILKILNRIKLGFAARILNLIIFKIPEYIYYYMYIIGIRFNKIDFFKISPLGYFFSAQKGD
ncbi:MAG: methyltransferase domain-containing protein [Ignavibacteria bacterium]